MKREAQHTCLSLSHMDIPIMQPWGPIQKLCYSLCLQVRLYLSLLQVTSTQNVRSTR